MTREKMQQKGKVGTVDMKMVNQLINWRDMRNCQLENTSYTCTLHPDENKRICKDCPKTIRKACFKYRWERDYIHRKEEAVKVNKRRKNKQNNPKYNGVETSVIEEDEDDFDEENITKEYSEDTRYLCGEMNFACPERDNCNYGQECQYKD